MQTNTPGVTVNAVWVRELSMHGAVALDLLSQRQRAAGPGNWFTITTSDMKDAIGITHFAWRNARKKLKNLGILQERDIPLDVVNKQPRRIEYLVDLEAVSKIGVR